MTQERALAILKTGANVFLTGEPGAGKTHTVNAYLRYLRAARVEPAITASTGIAATHIGGMTIHSWTGAGIRPTLTKHEVEEIASREYVAKRIARAKALVIDEVSMLGPNMITIADAVCRAVLRSDAPFGGLQVIFVGDFFQLPPIDREREGVFFAYDSPAWAAADPVVCYLTEQHRQDDDDFSDILSAIRHASFDEERLAPLAARRAVSGAVPDTVPRLFSHNADVDAVNDRILSKLPGDTKTFAMSSHGPRAMVVALEKGCLSPKLLRLKKGATVMFTKNNPQERFVNGTLGTVVDFSRGSGRPLVETRDGRRITADPMDWAIEEGGKERARVTQIPLRLAWAMTVHKSQGISLDEAVMDLSRVFEFGQGYVALSRVKRLSGLHLIGWNERAFQVHPDVFARDHIFRRASDAADTLFAGMGAEKLALLHADFVRRSGGKMPAPGEEPSDAIRPKSYASLREKHPNAYRRWDDAQDAALREMFGSDENIAALAKHFERQPGAIRMRLIKLGLIDLLD